MLHFLYRLRSIGISALLILIYKLRKHNDLSVLWVTLANTNSDNIIIVKLKTSWSLSFKMLPCLKYNVDILLMAATREMCHLRKHFEIISCLHLVLSIFPAMRLRQIRFEFSRFCFCSRHFVSGNEMKRNQNKSSRQSSRKWSKQWKCESKVYDADVIM